MSDSYETPKTAAKILDSGISEELVRIDGLVKPTFEQLIPQDAYLENVKKHFFKTDKKAIPNLRATLSRPEVRGLLSQENELFRLKQEVLASGLHPIAKQAYRWRINEMSASARMIDASVRGDMRRFRAYNQFIYGRPDAEIFASVVDHYRQQADIALENNSDAVKQAAHEVLRLLPDQGGVASLLKPDPEVLKDIKERRFREGGYFALLLAGVDVPSSGKFNAENGNPILEKVLANLGGDYGLKPKAGTTWSVAHNEPAMMYPLKYNLERKRFLGLPIGHEAKHILERLNGMKQPMRLFGLGLDRYETGNEGTAVLNEIIQYDNFDEFAVTDRWQILLRRHLATSLAEGLASNGQEMNFPQVFKIINAIDKLMWRQKKPDDIQAANTQADARSWTLVQSVEKGTDGQGGAYGRYKIYLEGLIRIWQAAAKDPNLIEYSDLGKFDIANPRHIALAQALGVLPTPE